MYKIDKSTWDQMSANKDKVIKQWVPQPHVINEKSNLDTSTDPLPSNNSSNQINNPDEILEKATKEAEGIKSTAFKEGYKEGLEQVRNKFDVVYQKQSSELATILNEINDNKKRYNEEIEDKSLKLALVIAEKILNMKIENDDKVFVGLVNNALAMMDEEEKFILRLSNREYERHFKKNHEAFLKELQSDVPITVIKDSSLTNGGVIIESDKSFVDASVDTQIKKISNSITKRDTQYHEAL